MVVVLCYVDRCGVLEERLTGIVHFSETTTLCPKSNINVSSMV
jgi:hypothetical protein